MTFKIIRETSKLTELKRKFPQYIIRYHYGSFYFYKSVFSFYEFAHEFGNCVFSHSENPDAIFVAKELDYLLIIMG